MASNTLFSLLACVSLACVVVQSYEPPYTTRSTRIKLFSVDEAPPLLNETSLMNLTGMPEPFVIGGSEVSGSQYNFMAALLGSDGSFWYFTCGGSVLTRNKVLTAGHCFGGSSFERYAVLLGTSNLDNLGGSQFIAVSNIAFAPGYNVGEGFLPNDAAVLTLSQNAVLNSNVGTIGLANPGDGYFPQSCTVLGWGTTSFNGPIAIQIRRADFYAFPNFLCSFQWSLISSVGVRGDQMCAINFRQAVCNGDSGGPLICARGRASGIVSWGYRGCPANVPDVYTRVANYRAWIEQQL